MIGLQEYAALPSRRHRTARPLDGKGGGAVARLLAILVQEIRSALADPLLQVLIVGVIGAAFLCAAVLGADAPTVLG